MEISGPYNVQHHMHIQPHQFRSLAKKSQNDLIAEFSAMRAAQSATGRVDAPDSLKRSSRNSFVGATQSVPASFQVTARSSLYAPEPTSPRSDQGTRHVGTKGSFSLPFRDGNSPKLQQESSNEGLNAPITEDQIPEDVQPRPPSETASTSRSRSSASKFFAPATPRTLDGSPVSSTSLRPDDSFSTTTMEGLKTGFWPSAAEQESFDFKELSPVKTRRGRALLAPQYRFPASAALVHDLDDFRVSMNRSSVDCGLFSSWAADDDSSDDEDEVMSHAPAPSRTLRKKGPNRLLQKAIWNSHGIGVYTAPLKPPPACPLPRVPDTHSPISQKSDGAQEKLEHENEPNPDAHPADAALSAVVDDATKPADIPHQCFPARRSSSKSVRFKADDTFIPNKCVKEHEGDTSMTRVQATLDDLRNNISQLEIDLSNHSPDLVASGLKGPETTGSKDASSGPAAQRPRALSSPRQSSRLEFQGSRIPRPAHRVTGSGSINQKYGSDIPAIPPLPDSAIDISQPNIEGKTHDRTLSNGSFTIPSIFLPATVAVQ